MQAVASQRVQFEVAFRTFQDSVRRGGVDATSATRQFYELCGTHVERTCGNINNTDRYAHMCDGSFVDTDKLTQLNSTCWIRDERAVRKLLQDHGIVVVTSAMSSLSASVNGNHLLHPEYRGVIAIVAGHVPSLSCAQCMLQNLTTVLPEVVRMDFIVQECTRKLESLQRARRAALTLPANMAFAIIAYTYDLGLSSATDDGR